MGDTLAPLHTPPPQEDVTKQNATHISMQIPQFCVSITVMTSVGIHCFFLKVTLYTSLLIVQCVVNMNATYC